MGLGKTLTSIAFIYAMVHHRLAPKAVVVVPSSLVGNWRAEFSKWLRLLMSPHAGSADRRVLVADASYRPPSGAPVRPKKGAGSKKAAKAAAGSDSDGGEVSCTGAEGAVRDFVGLKGHPVLVIRFAELALRAPSVCGPCSPLLKCATCKRRGS